MIMTSFLLETLSLGHECIFAIKCYYNRQTVMRSFESEPDLKSLSKPTCQFVLKKAKKPATSSPGRVRALDACWFPW